MIKSNKGLTKADIARLGPAAKAQVLAQLEGTVVALPTKPAKPRLQQPQTAPTPVLAVIPPRAGLGSTKHHEAPWGPFYPVMLIILLIIVWKLLIGAMTYVGNPAVAQHVPPTHRTSQQAALPRYGSVSVSH